MYYIKSCDYDRSWQVDGNWQQWHVPAWNVTTNGSTRRRQRYCLGIGTWKVRHKGFIDSFSLDLKAEWWLWLFFRPTMIKYGYDNIRDLVGHKIDLEKVQETPICRLDKYEQTVWYIIFVFSFPTFTRLKSALRARPRCARMESHSGLTSSTPMVRTHTLDLTPDGPRS